VTDQIEVIYDAAVAAEKLKDGTKYERLTAIVFKILVENSYVVHDLRLRADSKQTRHQIDVVVSSGPSHTAHRILVECKAYGEGTKVGLEEILAFNGRLVQFPGSRGIFVTTVGYTEPACSYARDEHITLVQLRPFTDPDKVGRLTQVNVSATAFFLGIPVTNWIADGRVVSAPDGLPAMPGGIHLDDTFYYDEGGLAQGNLSTLLEDWKRELRRNVPMDGTPEVSGTYTLPPGVWLPVSDKLAEFSRLEWRAPVLHMSKQLEVSSRSVADLILRTVQLADNADPADTLTAALGGSGGRVVFRHQLQDWVVDEHKVVSPRPEA
jgi:hypothetical protein